MLPGITLCIQKTNDNVTRNNSLYREEREKFTTRQFQSTEISVLVFNNVIQFFCLALTSPPNFFTPRFLGFESRPFLVDPAVFLVAQRLNNKLNPTAAPSETQLNNHCNHQICRQSSMTQAQLVLDEPFLPLKLLYTGTLVIKSLTFSRLQNVVAILSMIIFSAAYPGNMSKDT